MTQQHPAHGRPSTGKARLLHHNEAVYFPAAGCATCTDRLHCGGLATAGGLFDCYVHCCGKPNHCRWLCRRNDHFRQQVQEVRGLSLDNVHFIQTPQAPDLPDYVPLLYHGARRLQPLAAPAVAIKFAQMFDRRSGVPRFATRDDLLNHFMIDPAAHLIVTGVDDDPVIERWWGIGQNAQRQVIEHLVALGITIATTPNFTMSLNWPRPGDLIAMKRILLNFAEMMNGGLPAALHVNGRTPHDFQRWGRVLQRLEGITHLAYEFTTGTAHVARRAQHIAWLSELPARAGRPLHIIVFGDQRVVVPLKRAFASVTWIDTSAFIKTVHHRRAVRSGNAELGWTAANTPTDAPYHELLAHNVHENRLHFSIRTAA